MMCHYCNYKNTIKKIKKHENDIHKCEMLEKND